MAPRRMTTDYRPTERTKHSPIADGRVSVQGALVFLTMHLVLLVALLWPPQHSCVLCLLILDEPRLKQVHAIAGSCASLLSSHWRGSTHSQNA